MLEKFNSSWLENAFNDIEKGQLLPVLHRFIQTGEGMAIFAKALAFVNSMCLSEDTLKHYFKILTDKWENKDDVKFQTRFCQRIRQIHYVLQLADKARTINEPVDVASQIAHAPTLPEIMKGFGAEWPGACLAWLCSEEPNIPRRSLKIPVALYKEDISENEKASSDIQEPGFIAWLHLELWQGLTGAFQHPQDFYTDFHDDFHEAMRTAWQAANKLHNVRDNSTTPPSAGCWRLMDLHGKPLQAIQGNSAGGAAARGWYHLLAGTHPDAELIVMAAIDAEGQLAGVGGINEKLQAVIKAEQFDTVVVGSEGNKMEASKYLDKARIKNLRVVLPE